MGCARRVSAIGGRVVLVLVALASLLLQLPPPVMAAGSPTTGSTGYSRAVLGPVENSDIRLEEQTIQATCYRTFAEYRADYRFVNAGADQQVYVGFPVPDRGFRTLGFRAWRNDTPVEICTRDTGRFSGNDHVLLDVRFPPGETMITVSYLAHPEVETGYRESDPDTLVTTARGEYYEYLLHTAGQWRGTIGKAVIRYELADNFAGRVVDSGNDDRTYQRVVEDLEPIRVDEFSFVRPRSVDDIVFAYVAPVVDVSEGWDPGKELPEACGTIATLRAASGSASGVFHDSARPSYAVDGDLRTGWSWAPDGEAWLEVDIHGDHQLREIRIVPGQNYQDGDFRTYGRPKSIKVELSDGSSTVITLEDQPTLQRFALAGYAEWVRLEVLDVYPGTYSYPATISEIDFGTEPAPAFRSFSELILEEQSEADPPVEPSVPSASDVIVGSGIDATPSGAPSPIGVLYTETVGPEPEFSDGPGSGPIIRILIIVFGAPLLCVALIGVSVYFFHKRRS